VHIEGRQLEVSNLDKVLFPEVGFTKAQVIDYYVRIAPVLLPHVARRAGSCTRWG
jgi:bifunctional non-homologous end joining protein LigD